MNFRKLTPLAGLVALALVAGGNHADAATANDSGPGTARPIERTVTGAGIGVQAGRPAGRRRHRRCRPPTARPAARRWAR